MKIIFGVIDFGVVSYYYDICYSKILLITIPNLYPNRSQTMEIYTGHRHVDGLDILIPFSYPSSIAITRVYCSATYMKGRISMRLYVTIYV